MSALESRIDELYALPLAAFTEARNALAKSLTGDDRARVKRLEKPTVVPWAVNQVYWHERRAWDRVMAAGRALRAAQLAALEGTAASVRDSSTAHRSAVSDAVAAAQHLAARHGAHPASDDLFRMLDAISLAAEPPASPGTLHRDRSTGRLRGTGRHHTRGTRGTARSSASTRPGDVPRHSESHAVRRCRAPAGGRRGTRRCGGRGG